MVGRNRFFDNELFKTEQELMVEQLEAEQALEAEDPVLQLESLDRLAELQALVSNVSVLNDGIRYSAEEHLGYIPETLELTQEGIVDSIWNGIRAFFQAIAKFIGSLFGERSKSSEARADSYLQKVKDFDAKYGEARNAKWRDWYPDSFSKSKAAALKALPDDAKVERAVEQLEQEYAKDRFKVACAHVSLLPTLSIYSSLNSAVISVSSGLPQYSVSAELFKNQQEQNSKVNLGYVPVELKASLPGPVYNSLEQLYGTARETMPVKVGEVSAGGLRSVLSTARENEKLKNYHAIFNTNGGSKHVTKLMNDYQTWIDRTGKELPKLQKQVEGMEKAITKDTPPQLAENIRALGKDINGQIAAINFVYDLLDQFIQHSSYLIDIDLKIGDLTNYMSMKISAQTP